VLSIETIDRELASRTKEVADMSATLIELESHPGLEHLRRYPPTGVTGQRWAVVEKSLAQLWEDLGRMTSIVDAARSLRVARSRPDDADRRELTRWLRGRPLEVSRERIPLAQRTIAGPAETVESVGLVDTADRMRADYPAVIEFLDAVDRVDSMIANGLAPIQERLDADGMAVPKELADLLVVSAVDPLSLTAYDVDQRIASIAGEVQRRSTERAELAVLQANWPAALAGTVLQLDVLRQATQRAALAQTNAQRSVLTSPLPSHGDAEPGLRAALESITALDCAALLSLRRRIDAAIKVARRDEELAQGLLDRRTELTGRLTAYQAKATRLGLGEDPDLLAAGRIAAGLLTRRPCDIRVVTRAIVDFQQLIREKQGRTR
jgi:hypothetical protein